MKIVYRRGLLWFAAAALALLSGCVASGGYGYGSGYDGQYYYQPGGYVYSGWGPGYPVGPPRGGHDHDDHGDQGRSPQAETQATNAAPAYRPAPAGHSAPSIPNQSRPH
jgi:hypothetical protein